MLQSELHLKISQLRQTGLDHVKFSTEDEGLTWDELKPRIELMKMLDVPVWIKIGGCEAIGDIRKCKQEGVAGIVAPMIETCYAAVKFFDSINKVYGGIGVPPDGLSVNIESGQAAVNIVDIIHITKNELIFFTVGMKDFKKSLEQVVNLLTGRSFFSESYINNEIKKTINYIKSNGRVAIGGGITPATVNQVIEDYHPDYIQTRNFCFKIEYKKSMVASYWDFKDEAIRIALEAEILLLQLFNGDQERVKELRERLK